MTPWEYFADDPAGGADFLEIARRGTGELLLCTHNAIMMREPAGDLILLHAKDEVAAEALITVLGPAAQYAVHGDRLAQLVQKKTGFRLWEKCVQTCYLEKKAPDFVSEAEFKMLGPEYETMIVEHYGDVIGADYARERLAAGVVMGAFLKCAGGTDGAGDTVSAAGVDRAVNVAGADGVLAGFIGTHPEGSMGMLHIFTEYRRRHLGFALEAEQIRRFLEQGIIPFCQIVDTNAASLALQKKLGMTFSDELVYWLYAV